MTTPTPLAESLERLESLHAEIMALPCIQMVPENESDERAMQVYTFGHQDARRAAAELVAERVGPLVEAVKAAPQQHAHPTCPGLWLELDDQGTVRVTADDVDWLTGAWHGGPVYGPLPLAPQTSPGEGEGGEQSC